MAALKLRRRAPIVDIEPEDKPEIEQTPVMTGLALLIALAERDGLKAAADALVEDPSMLGLARAVSEADSTAAAMLWENSYSSRTYNPQIYSRCMEAMGLLRFAHSSEFFRDAWDWQNPPPQDFRINDFVHSSGKRFPVIVVPVLNQFRKIGACVLLYVAPDWSGWADVSPRTQIVGRVEAQELRFQRSGSTLAVAASFETAAAAQREVGGFPVWITLTPENMAECFNPPAGVRRLYLLHATKVERTSAIKAATRIDAEYAALDIVLFNPITEKVERWPLE